LIAKIRKKKDDAKFEECFFKKHLPSSRQGAGRLMYKGLEAREEFVSPSGAEA